jgi:hypothetical protein
MKEAELRGLVGSDLIGPGREDVFLTGTGRVVAEVKVASDRGPVVQANRVNDFHQHMITKLQQAALDGDFSEWVRNAVERFAKDYDLLDAAIHTEVIRQYENLYEDFVAKHFPTDDGPIWLGGSPAEIEIAMREDIENTEKFRAADAWSKNGSRCLSCGRDFANRPIDLATLTEDACRTLAALYLMYLGDSVLLASNPPNWNEWLGSDDEIERSIAWMVDGIKGPPDDRFERIGLVIERVLSEWNRNAAAALPSGPQTVDRVPATDNRSVVEKGGNLPLGDTPDNQLTAQEARQKLGELLVEACDLNETNNLTLQKKANDLIEEHNLPLSAYESENGNGVADLYKRTYLRLKNEPWRGDRRGKGKSK